MSRITLAEFVSEVLSEVPELPFSVREELAEAAGVPESRRPAVLRTVLEKASLETPGPQEGLQNG